MAPGSWTTSEAFFVRAPSSFCCIPPGFIEWMGTCEIVISFASVRTTVNFLRNGAFSLARGLPLALAIQEDDDSRGGQCPTEEREHQGAPGESCVQRADLSPWQLLHAYTSGGPAWTCISLGWCASRRTAGLHAMSMEFAFPEMR